MTMINHAGTNNMEVKKVNKNRIFRYLYENGKLSKQDIAYSLQMSFPTVAQNLKELLKQGLVVEDGWFESTGGRKAKAIAYNRNARYAVGLDITKNHVSVVIVNLGVQVILHERIRRRFENAESYFKNLGSLIDEQIRRAEIDPSKVCGVGIAVPGILSDDGKTVVYSPILGFTGGTCECFSRYIPYPCVLCNDANAAGFAELWNSHDGSNVVYLSLSDSVGGSVMVNGRIYPGENQRSGEFGHMTIVPDGRLCYCGKKGCVDAYCSARILSDAANGSLPGFFSLLKKNSKPHREIWEAYLYYLSITVNNLRMLFDCRVIIGGYVGSYMEDYIVRLRELASRRNTFGPDGSYIRSCSYKLESIAVGAALLHIERLINGI